MGKETENTSARRPWSRDPNYPNIRMRNTTTKNPEPEPVDRTLMINQEALVKVVQSVKTPSFFLPLNDAARERTKYPVAMTTEQLEEFEESLKNIFILRSSSPVEQKSVREKLKVIESRSINMQSNTSD